MPEVKLPRRKTGISRDLPLWPETVEALEKIPHTGKQFVVFIQPNRTLKQFFFGINRGNKQGWQSCKRCQPLYHFCIS